MKSDIEKLFDEFINECQFAGKLRPETLRGYKRSFSLFKQLVPSITLESLTTTTITNFFRILQERTRIVGKGVKKTGVKDSTAFTYRNKLNTFFEWLEARQHILKNPLALMKNTRPRPDYSDSKSLRHNEIEKIIVSIQNNSSNLLQMKRDMAMIYTLLFTGIRRGEFAGLKIMDYDFERKSLTVRAETSKSKKSRIMPLNSQVYIRIDDYLQERRKSAIAYKTPGLFASLNCDKGLSLDGLKHWVKRLEMLSGVKFHLHRFRHTFTHNLAAKNVSAVKIQKLLGHSDLRMTQRYLRSLTPEDMREDVDRLNIDDLV